MVISIDRNRLFVLNPTATRLWEALAEPRCLDELAFELGRTFRIDEATARRDCDRFCCALRDRGLLVAIS